AGRLLAQPDEARRVFAEQLATEAREVQVRQRPGRAVVAVLEHERLDVRAREEDDGLLERREYLVLLHAREEPAHHRLDLVARQATVSTWGSGLWESPSASRRTSRTRAPRRSSWARFARSMNPFP